MHRFGIISALAMGLGTACTGGDNIGVSGHAMDTYFVFDGTCRGWELVSSDVSLPYKLVGKLQPEPTVADDEFTRIHTIEYSKLCITSEAECTDGEVVKSITMSSTRGDGTLVYEYMDSGGAMSFDPPVALTLGTQEILEEAVSETGGATVTSELTELGACDIQWAEWSGCVHLTVDDGGANTGLAGEIWAAPGWNIVAMEIGADTGRWSLDRAVFETSVQNCEDEELPVLSE